MRRIVWTGFTALALVLAGCGGSSAPKRSGEERSLADVLAAVDGLSGKERTDRLLELAGDEGEALTFYTSYSNSILADLADTFEDAYDVDVAVYRAGAEEVLQRLLEESRAGFRGADVVENNGLRMIAANADGLLEPYDSPSLASLAPGAAHEGWTADAVNAFALTWSTKLVREGEQPRSWEELADPRWKGKLALDVTDVDWYKTLWEHWIDQGKSEDEVERLFEGIARNARFVKGHTLNAQLQAAGEFELFVNYAHIADLLAREGAPLAWRPPVEPVMVRTDGVGIVDGARHPAAAALFVDWLLSDGQEVLAKAGVAMRKDLIATEGAKAALVDLDSLASEQEEWSERYERLARLGAKAG